MARVGKDFFSDMVRGHDTAIHKFRMFAMSAVLIGLLSLSAGGTMAWVYVLGTTKPADRSWARSYLISSALDAFYLRGTNVTVRVGDRDLSAPAAEVARLPQLAEAAGRVGAQFKVGALLGLLVAAAVMVLAMYAGWRRGWRLRQDEHIRGGSIAEPVDLARRLGREGKASPDLRIGEVPIILNSETGHLLIAGTTGAGKSTLIESLLDAIRARGDRAIIADVGGETTARHWRCGDPILAPLDARSESWSPTAEMRGMWDADRVAKVMCPDAVDARDREWQLYSQTLIAAVMQRLVERGEATNEKLLYYLTIAPSDELQKLVAGLPAQTLFDTAAAKMQASVRGIIGSYLPAYRYLPGDAGVGAWSIRHWVESGSGWLWLPYRDDQAAALRPLLSAWIGEAVSAILSLRPDPNRRIWMILDECASLGRVQALADALGKGRKYGLCAVLGVQSVAQLRQTYGREGAEVLTGTTNTWAVFRAGDPDTARWLADALGEREVERVDESLQYSAAETRDAISLHHKVERERIVLPTEIMQLPDLQCFVRLPGDYPISRTKIARRERPQVCEPFIERPSAGTVGCGTPAPGIAENVDDQDGRQANNIATTPEPQA